MQDPAAPPLNERVDALISEVFVCSLCGASDKHDTDLLVTSCCAPYHICEDCMKRCINDLGASPANFPPTDERSTSCKFCCRGPQEFERAFVQDALVVCNDCIPVFQQILNDKDRAKSEAKKRTLEDKVSQLQREMKFHSEEDPVYDVQGSADGILRGFFRKRMPVHLSETQLVACVEQLERVFLA